MRYHGVNSTRERDCDRAGRMPLPGIHQGPIGRPDIGAATDAYRDSGFREASEPPSTLIWFALIAR
jgi:hypothetical protein